jgi:hypothetical protein
MSEISSFNVFLAMARKWQFIIQNQTLTFMILQFFFRQLSAETQVSYLQKNGVSLGSRAKNGRRIYVYMVRNLFVEVMYENDNENDTPEKVNMLRGLKNLNSYLEKEFRASF